MSNMGRGKDNLIIAAWIAARLKGTILPEEEKDLDNWIEESARNKAFYDRVTDTENISNRFCDYDSYSLDTVREKVMSVVRRDRKRIQRGRWYRLIAAVLLIPILGLGAFYFINPELEEVVVVADIQPGGDRAILETADGRRIDLSGQFLANIHVEGVVVKNDSNMLSYQVDINIPKAELEYNTIIIPRGGEYKLTLSDGTRVWLNSETRLRYPTAFIGERREVYLDGEAYFEVSHSGKPFEVHCEGMDVRVLGTSFNVMAYRGESIIQTTLVDGSVRVTSLKDPAHNTILTPGHQAEMNTVTGKVETREVNVEDYVGWKDQLFVFNDEKMDIMMRKLSRWYDVEIVIESPTLREAAFYGVIKKYENISKILDMLKKTLHVDYTIEGRRVIIKEVR